MPAIEPVLIHLAADATACDGQVLARFDARTPHTGAAPLPLRPLGGAGPEHWIGCGTTTPAVRGSIRYHADAHWLVGHLSVDAEDAELAAFRTYRALGDFISTGNHPFLIRTWNFLDRLNHGHGDAERYRRFCIGRHRAIVQPGFESRLPAATVIGTDDDLPGLHLSFLAATAPGLQIENPRQTSAFAYPRDYGPVAPSFSRATLVGPHLLVSGTAAVVGHATRHPHDAAAQLDEITANLEALLAHASGLHPAGSAAGCWTAQALRLYVRRPQDADIALRRLRAWIPARVPVSILRGDISRADLMVEIEGVWTWQQPAAQNP